MKIGYFPWKTQQIHDRQRAQGHGQYVSMLSSQGQYVSMLSSQGQYVSMLSGQCQYVSMLGSLFIPAYCNGKSMIFNSSRLTGGRGRTPAQA